MQRTAPFLGFIFFLLLFIPAGLLADTISVVIEAGGEKKAISPYIYGKNNSLSDKPDSPLSASEWQRLKDAGITIFREGGGNNSTKYNWRRKLTSHPDWYNNVFPHDWDFAASSLQGNIPNAMGFWSLQVMGWAAKSEDYNFNSWEYNRSNWWSGVEQNLAGGGEVNETGGGEALVEGDADLYLEEWPADSTVGILDHWFSADGLGLDSTKLIYWNMDNEGDIWSGTHDDVLDTEMEAEEFMQKYFEVAKKARAMFPGIRLVGPVTTNEWQWYNWYGSKISYKGEELVWLEFFIKRLAEMQDSANIRLLDVLDIHFYPTETDARDIVQLHRVYYDRTYDYPGANGVKRSGPGGWDNSITHEYIFGRCNDWLTEYMGADHGVGFSVSETGIKGDNPNVTAVWYASTMGEFARQGMEIFTPWTWKIGMWETLHLFSNYNLDYYVPGNSELEEVVSAYPTINAGGDSMTLVLVNRSLEEPRIAEVQLNDFAIHDGFYQALELEALPDNETFQSHSSNALRKDSILVRDSAFVIDLEPLSIVSLSLSGKGSPYIALEELTVSSSSGKYIIDSDQGVLQMRVSFTPEHASYTDVSWSVSDNTLALISDDGLLSALGNGSLWVKASCLEENISDSVEITIQNQIVEVTGVEISKADNRDTIQVQEGIQFRATIIPEEATNTNVDWSVSNENISSISEEGYLLAVESGEVWVKVITEDGLFSDSLKLVIEPLLSIENIRGGRFKIYPNPVSEGSITLYFNQEYEAKVVIQLYDIQGKVVNTLLQKTLPPGQHHFSFDLSEYQNGLYLLCLKQKNSKIYQKLIISNEY